VAPQRGMKNCEEIEWIQTLPRSLFFLLLVHKEFKRKDAVSNRQAVND
jgi:hypothetical protein